MTTPASDSVILEVDPEEVEAPMPTEVGHGSNKASSVDSSEQSKSQSKSSATAASCHATQSEKQQPQPPSGADKPKSLRFFTLLSEMHSMVVLLDGYPRFLCKYIPLQVVKVTAAGSFLVVAHVMAKEFDDAFGGDDESNSEMGSSSMRSFSYTPAIICAFAILGSIQLLATAVPFLCKILIDELKGGLKVMQALAVVRKVFDLPHDAMISTPTGEFAQLIGKIFQMDAVMPCLYETMFPMLGEVILVGCFIAVVYGYPALILLFLFVSHTLLSYRLAAKKANRAKDAMKGLLENWGKILQVAGSYELAHVFGNVSTEVNRAKHYFSKIDEDFKKFMQVDWDALGLQLFSIVCSFALIGLVLHDMSGDTTDPESSHVSSIELVALAMYCFKFVGALVGYGGAISQLRSGVAEYEVVHTFLDRLSDVKDSSNAIELEDPSQSDFAKNLTIEFDHVSFSYGGRQILDDVSFCVNAGQTVGLVGSSGCGKSTIIRLLMRFYRPTSGVIRVNGHDLSDVTAASLRRLFSVVTQDARLFNATLRENLAYGKLGSSDDELLRAAQMAELNLEEIESIDVVDSCKNEAVTSSTPPSKKDMVLDKMCGEAGAKLSGGQQQRVAIARAILKNGPIFLLDEPTAALDNVVAHQIQQTLTTLAADRQATTICITHNLRDLQNASQILYLKEGRIVEQGTFGQLMEAKGVFYQQVQAKH